MSCILYNLGDVHRALKQQLIAVVYYQFAKSEADNFNPDAFNDVWVNAMRQEILSYMEIEEYTMAFNRCKAACRRFMHHDSSSLSEENIKLVRADFWKLLKNVKNYRDSVLKTASEKQRLRMENLLEKFDKELDTGRTGGTNVVNSRKTSYREHRKLSRMLLESMLNKNVKMQLQKDRQLKKLDQKYGKNRARQITCLKL